MTHRPPYSTEISEALFTEMLKEFRYGWRIYLLNSEKRCWSESPTLRPQRREGQKNNMIRTGQSQHDWHFGLDNPVKGRCPVHSRIVSGIPGLYLLDASAPLPTTKMSPDIVKCPLGAQISSSWNHWIRRNGQINRVSYPLTSGHTTKDPSQRRNFQLHPGAPSGP